ncbi:MULTISPECIES: chorismate lyase [Salinivibrio]|uniref:Probable chorismate pyruvate-lyase n=1 Tax=Salinivibrio proteolyticus TaxID=334715 RepID=A0ABY7LES4_9GAMM|nr:MULTISPECIES: chorismate lyase [Salinivibrio]ODP99937.1 chorismate--pyruvate lyase [Salinivibrio sp. DV]OOF11854.1 chorismate--pyruvate lyase [Salinivibrio sp. PR5]OOF27128.1 chorismate--pyruvate lyase [Salinivibrio proteolyticus]WBA14844.1 chorismate lyase [Salinivibrio proteolyticus]
MSDLNQTYLAALKQARWERPDIAALKRSQHGSWLLESHSMTARLKRHCQRFDVDVVNVYQLTPDKLTTDEVALIGHEACVVREVILKGDGHAWVCGRTLLPASTLEGQGGYLNALGAVPLGQHVFKQRASRRDAIEVAEVTMPTGGLQARRSRLWLHNRPMLVAELFLPDSPMYGKEIPA